MGKILSSYIDRNCGERALQVRMRDAGHKRQAAAAGQIVQFIVRLRGHKVLLDTIPADLYVVAGEKRRRGATETFPKRFLNQLPQNEH